ncbi:helix-turn-helix domain-containing protein [Enterococcus sp. AZ072]|uniref:helix-turn-helix domain-containing protein n=1 Tax=unclassified Enterococcus TaxID=2608891 RepID=UPI003D29794B
MENELFDLLETKNQMIYRIIDLSKHENEWLEVQKIANELSLNERSIQRYIHYLEEITEEFNASGKNTVEITYSKFKGLRLESNSGTINDLKTFIIYSDETVKLLIEMCLIKTKTTKQYSEENFISMYSVKKSLDKISLLLAKFNLSINRSNLSFCGEEKNIRVFTYMFLWAVFKNDSWPFSYISEEKILQSVDIFFEEAGIQTTKIHKKQMLFMSAVCLMRNKKKYFIESHENWDDYVNIGALRNESFISQEINNYQVYNDNEIYFILLVVQMQYRMFKSDTIKERILLFHEKKQTDVYRLTEVVMKNFQEEFFEIPEERKDVFFTYCFCAHLYCKVFPGIEFDINGQNIKNGKTFSDNLIFRLENFIEAIDFQTDILQEKVFLSKIYAAIFSHFKSPNSYDPRIIIGIDSEFPFLVRENLKVNLKRKFSDTFNLSVVESESGVEDILVTTMPSLYDSREHVCTIDYPLKERDYLFLEAELNKLQDSLNEHSIQQVS